MTYLSKRLAPLTNFRTTTALHPANCAVRTFGNAFVTDISTYLSGRVNEHRNRVSNEMQQTNGQVPSQAFPIILTSSPSLETSSLTHWIKPHALNPPPARAVPRPSRMQNLWRKFRDFLPTTRKGTTNSADLDLLRKYVQDVGTRASETPTAGFVNVCEKVINGRRDLKDNVMEVIHWQKDQFRMIELLLNHLATESYLTTYVEPEEARKFVQGINDQEAQVFRTIHARLSDIASVWSLLKSPNPKFIVVIQDGFNWLVDNVTMNRNKDLDSIAQAIESFLENYLNRQRS